MNEQNAESAVFELEKTKTVKAIQKKLASITKAIKTAQEQYRQSKEFEQVQHLAELVKANFPKLKKGMEEVTALDWKEEHKEVTIPLDPLSSPQEILEAMFLKSQKLKRAISPLEHLLKKFDDEIKRWHEALDMVQETTELHALKALQKMHNLLQEKPPKIVKKALPYHHYHSQAGIDILVGKSAASNDMLTFQVAHGNDLWLHAHGLSGAHVVVRRKKEQEIDSETLQDALQLALYYSKARNSPGASFEVLVSEQKYVSRLPRMPKGKVVVSKHKTMTVILDKERVQKITHRP